MPSLLPTFPEFRNLDKKVERKHLVGVKIARDLERAHELEIKEVGNSEEVGAPIVRRYGS